MYNRHFSIVYCLFSGRTIHKKKLKTSCQKIFSFFNDENLTTVFTTKNSNLIFVFAIFNMLVCDKYEKIATQRQTVYIAFIVINV